MHPCTRLAAHLIDAALWFAVPFGASQPSTAAIAAERILDGLAAPIFVTAAPGGRVYSSCYAAARL